MNLLDLGVLVLLGLVTVRGYFRGLFQELAVLVGVVGGVVAAAHGYLRLAELLAPWITDPQYARIVAFAAILVAVYWLTRLVAHFLQRLLYHLYLDFFDRLLGAAFALAKGALIIGFALIFIGAGAVIAQGTQLPQLTLPHAAAGGGQLTQDRLRGEGLIQRDQLADFVARGVAMGAMDGRQLDPQEDARMVMPQKMAERGEVMHRHQTQRGGNGA